MPPQNQANTSAQTPAPPPDFSQIRGWVPQAKALAQAKTALPSPQYMAPAEGLVEETKLGKAYDAMKTWLGTHEQHLSEKYLAPFRQGLDNMGEDLQQAAESGHTKGGGQLTTPARLLVGGVGTLLKQVPIGSNVKETAQALA